MTINLLRRAIGLGIFLHNPVAQSQTQNDSGKVAVNPKMHITAIRRLL